MAHEDLTSTLKALIGSSDSLCKLLLQEREALISRDSQLLQQIIDAKRDVCSCIEADTRRLGPTPLPEQIEAADSVHAQELDVLHKSLLALADKAQEYNAVNGKIVHRSQQSVRDLIHLISGMDAELLYGNQGQTMASAQGTAIARA